MSLPILFRGSGAPAGLTLIEGAAYFRTDALNGGLYLVRNGAWIALQTSLAAASAAVSVNSQKITNLGTPTTGTDAATKAYVDSVTGAPTSGDATIGVAGSAISATGDFNTNTKKVLSPGFFLGSDDPRTPQWAASAFSWGENLAGAGATRYFFGQGAHQGSSTAGGDVQLEGGAPDSTGLAGAAHLAAGDGSGVHTRRGVSVGETAGHVLAISFYGGALVAKQTRAGQLTDSTTGTPGATLVDVGASPTQANVNNNFASVLAKLNAIETILHNLGLST